MPLPAFFCRSLVACWTAGNSDAVVCFCQPSSVEIELNAVKLPLVFVGARKMPHLIHDTHGPCTQRFEHHVPCHDLVLRETAPCRYQPFCRSLVACWTAEKSDAVVCFCQPSSVEIELNAVKLPWVSVGASNATSRTFEHHVPCHNTTPWKQHTWLRTIFWFGNRALAACCVWETLNQRVKAGGPWTHRWHGPTKTHLCRRENVPAKLSSSEMARWPSQKLPMPTCHDMTWHANVTTWHDGYHFISFHPLHYGVYQSVRSLAYCWGAAVEQCVIICNNM